MELMTMSIGRKRFVRRWLPRAAAISACVASLAAAAPQSTPTPGTVSPDDPLSPSVLTAAMTVWEGREVRVGGHFWLFMGEEGAVGRELDLAPTPDADKDAVRVRCRSFSDKPTANLRRADPLVVRGVFEEASPLWNLVMLGDCSVVSTDAPFDEGAAADPAGPTDRVIPVAALHDAAFGWAGVEVSVVGRFWGGTYSSASDRTRFDIQDEGGAKVGCVQDGRQSAPQSAIDERDGVVVRGRIGAEMLFGSPQLEGCVWVNRD
jgi:hypothetical protein